LGDFASSLAHPAPNLIISKLFEKGRGFHSIEIQVFFCNGRDGITSLFAQPSRYYLLFFFFLDFLE
jgi:hypothetical protein